MYENNASLQGSWNNDKHFVPIIAVLLVLERRDPHSFWAPYFDILPRYVIWLFVYFFIHPLHDTA